MKVPRSSAASTAGCLERRLSAISPACGSLRLPPRPALAEQSGNPWLAEPVHAINRPDRLSRLDERGAVAGQSEPTAIWNSLDHACRAVRNLYTNFGQPFPRSRSRKDLETFKSGLRLSLLEPECRVGMMSRSGTRVSVIVRYTSRSAIRTTSRQLAWPCSTFPSSA